MATQFEKFIATMKKVLMLDQADLDFGIYRIMNQKRDQIESYLNSDLRRQVAEAIRENASSDAEALKKELTQLVATLTAAGMNPDDAPKVKELKGRIAQCGNSEELENEVYSHLTIFFGRYYDGGDFISQRRYKKDVYAIPYEGEEVKLYWANADRIISRRPSISATIVLLSMAINYASLPCVRLPLSKTTMWLRTIWSVVLHCARKRL